MGKKKYPAQIRYESKNPAITFRMKKYEKELIQDMTKKSGKSVSELVRYALLDLQKDFTEAIEKAYKEGEKKGRDAGFKQGRDEGYKEGHKKGFDEGHENGKEEGYKNGYEKGMNNWAIWVPCYKCWKPLFVKPNTEDHKKTIEEMKGRLKHSTCPE